MSAAFRYAGRCGRAYVAARDVERFFERFGFSRVPVDDVPDEIGEAAAAAISDGGMRDGHAAVEVMMLELPSRWTIP